jgi:outer membrane protein assembly factor BamB
MKVIRKYFSILLFVFGIFFSSYIVFNYTTRTRKPLITYSGKDEINVIGISSSGNSLAIGGKNGEILFFERGKNIPTWRAQSKSKITGLAISEKGEYIATIDNDHNLDLFSNSPHYVNNEISPRWTYNLQDHGTISGIHSSGGIPPLVFIVITVDDRIILLSNRDGIVWEYQTRGPKVTAYMSSDGRKVIATDSMGEAYVFNFNSANPVWSKSTGIRDPSLSFSQDSTIVVGGRTLEGKGEIQVLSLKDGLKLWEFNLDEPIISVSVSTDGTQVLSHLETGDMFILKNENGDVKVISISGSVSKFTTPSFGSYAAVLSTEGTLFFYYIPRNAPLWSYKGDNKASDIVISSTGDKVFLVSKNEVNVISNLFQSGFIPGSRRLWGVVFLGGVIGALLISNFSIESLEWHIIDRQTYIKIALCIILNGLLGLLSGNLNLILFGVLSCTIAGLLTWKREGLLWLSTSFFVTLMVSMLIGLLIGLLYWFNGAEQNIITLSVINLVMGGRRGILFGIINSIIWLTPVEFFSRALRTL